MRHTTMFAILVLCAAVALGPASSALAQTECPCVEPDNGNGTVTMLPNCPSGYEGPMVIVDGLVNATIQIQAVLTDILVASEVAGGNLGGTVSTFNASLALTMAGTGDLNGYVRFIVIPVSGVAHTAPRTPGDAVQDFDTDMFHLQGQIFGDPDFDQLGVEAGTDFGLPSPGHTTLTRLGPPGSEFQVDSFFDIAYRIDFQGQPGSVLEGMAGTTESLGRFELCPGVVSTQERTWGEVKALYH